jgi:hypothetical protein
MKKNSFYTAENNTLNPLFQQYLPHGLMQAKDTAFFMRKLSFIQCHLQHTGLLEKKAVENDTLLPPPGF